MRLRRLIFLVILFPIIFSSCIHFTKLTQGEPVSPQMRATLDDRLTEAEKLLALLDFSQAALKFENFEKEFPQNIFLYRSKLGHARALVGDEKYTEALVLYREVIDASLSSKPEFTALASYYSSYCYEALGDDPKTLAALLDAKNLADKLPIEIAQAELPARLAAYYNRSGDIETARKFYHSADQGIATVFHDSSTKSITAKARTLYLMGELSSNQLSVESTQAQMDSLAMLQIFSLRSIELNEPQWSPQALKNLQNNYKDLWNTILQFPKNRALDAFAAEQELEEIQIRALGQLLELMQKLKLFRSPTPSAENHFTAELFLFLKQLEGHAQKMLASKGILRLTPESQKRQSLHREGTIRDDNKTSNGPLPNEEINLQEN